MIRPLAKTLATCLLLMQAMCHPQAFAADNSKPVLDALLRFLDALDAADAPALKQLIYVPDKPPALQLCRDAFIDLVVAQKRLERAAQTRFPTQANRFRRDLDLIATPADRKSIAEASVMIDDSQEARLTLPGETSPIRMSLSPSGQWQVMLDVVEPDTLLEARTLQVNPDALLQLRIDRLRAMSEAVNLAASGIEGATSPDASAAETSLADRIAALKVDYRNKLDQLRNRPRMPRPHNVYEPD